MASNRELYNAIEERDRHINLIEQDLTELEAENDKQQDELISYRDELANLQVLLKQTQVDNGTLVHERSQLQEQVHTQKSQLDSQKNIIAAASKEREDAKKIQRDCTQSMHRLEMENSRLTATLLELEENEDILVNEIDTLATEKSKYQGQSEELAAKCDALYADIHEKTLQIEETLNEREKAENTLEREREVYTREAEEAKQKEAVASLECARLSTELAHERSKQREFEYVKQNQSFKRELVFVRKENANLHSLYDQCLLDKNLAEKDLDSAIQALNHSKRHAKEEVAASLRQERVAATEANAKLERERAKIEGVTKKCLDTEEKLEDLRSQLEHAEARNAEYEQKNGLTQAVQRQKQLEADIRRRDHDLKKTNFKLGQEIEKSRVLAKGIEWLKEKADYDPQHKFDDEEIKLALKREDSILQSHNEELSRQIEAIEDERLKLLAQLRERAIDIGDKGARFLGLSSQQVVQVTEFATNLRQGIVALPLNDRSKELSAEISSLKSDKEVARLAIQRLERELAAKGSSPRESSESNILKQILDNLAAENQRLKNEIGVSKSVGATKVETKADGGNVVTSSTLTPLLRQRAKTVLGGQDLVPMPAAAEVQFISIMDEYERTSQELSLLKNSMANISSAAIHDQKCNDDNNIILESTNMGVDKQDNGTNTSLVVLSDVPTQLENESSERNTISSSMNKAMEELRHERDVISTQLRQLVDDAKSSNQIELVSEEVTKLTEKLKSIEDRLNNNNSQLDAAVGVFSSSIEQQVELKSVKQSLSKTKQKLSGYITDVKKLQNAIHTMQDSRVDSAKVECLNDIIKEKNRIIDETKQKLHASKQMNLKLARTHTSTTHDRFNSDRSVSTNSIDRAILRVANNNNNSGYNNLSSSRNSNLQQHLEEASRLIFEKDHVISEQNLAITELETKVKSHEQLVKESESMRHDISTLVSQLNEAESAANRIAEMKTRHEKEVKSIKTKLSSLSKEKTYNENKIKELNDTVARTKRVLSVTKQGRARSEQYLKTANEETEALKLQLSKVDEQMNALRKDKTDALNEKLQATRRARLSLTKLKDLTDSTKGNAKSNEELEKRVMVLNKTVQGLASTNSKLRGELTAHKMKKSVEDDEVVLVPQQQIMIRPSFSRERPDSTNSRANALESQVQRLQRSLAQEKKLASDSSAMLDRYQKRINSLENALRNSPTTIESESIQQPNDTQKDKELQEQLSSLTDENENLKQRIKDLASTSADTNIGTQLRKLKDENAALTKENERLSQIDHLDFFEEIEDLKYKYNEAVRQINQLTS